ARADGVEETVAMHGVPARIGDEDTFGVALSGPLGDVLEVDVVEGREDVAGTDLLVSQTTAAEKGWRVGDAVTLTSRDGEDVATTVSGIFADNQLLGSWVVSEEVYQEFTAPASRADFVVFVDTAAGSDPDAIRAALEDATKQFVVVQVLDREQFKGQQAAQIDTLLAVLYGLLALAVVIAILGIVNTLALSVVERRREIGMLRAVGMQRVQVRRTIYLESMLIAVFGAVVGLVLGLAFGWGFVRTLADQGLDQIAVPWGQVLGMLVGSAVVGVLAALWPGVRAARTPPLEAISDI
ncbi:ABC transporter permease, partial [Rhodococcus sp. P14]